MSGQETNDNHAKIQALIDGVEQQIRRLNQKLLRMNEPGYEFGSEVSDGPAVLEDGIKRLRHHLDLAKQAVAKGVTPDDGLMKDIKRIAIDDLVRRQTVVCASQEAVALTLQEEKVRAEGKLREATAGLHAAEEELRGATARLHAAEEELRGVAARLFAAGLELRGSTARLEELKKKDDEGEFDPSRVIAPPAAPRTSSRVSS